MSLKLNGPSAIAVLIVVVAFGGFRALTARASLDAEARSRIQDILVGEYTSGYLAQMDQSNPTEADVEALMARSRPEIVDLRARGRRDDMIVRTEIRIDGRPPTDGKGVRYWRMQHQNIGGWRLRRETTALSYYLKLF